MDNSFTSVRSLSTTLYVCLIGETNIRENRAKTSDYINAETEFVGTDGAWYQKQQQKIITRQITRYA